MLQATNNRSTESHPRVSAMHRTVENKCVVLRAGRHSMKSRIRATIRENRRIDSIASIVVTHSIDGSSDGNELRSPISDEAMGWNPQTARTLSCDRRQDFTVRDNNLVNLRSAYIYIDRRLYVS